MKSSKNVFATIRIRHQGDRDFNYLDIIMGEEGDTEHSHITFYFDGNGKCILSRKYKCELESMMQYDPTTRDITPLNIKLIFDDFETSLKLQFKYSPQKKVVELKSATFDK